jgi:hypothetical protein
MKWFGSESEGVKSVQWDFGPEDRHREVCQFCTTDLHRKAHWFNFSTGAMTCWPCYEARNPDDPMIKTHRP